MNCDKDNIVLYWSGELDPSARQKTEGHIASCPACSEILDDLNSINKLCDAPPEFTPSRDLVTQALTTSRHRRMALSPLVAVGIGAATAILLVSKYTGS